MTGLSALQIAKLVGFVSMLSCGQVLFKKVALTNSEAFTSASGLLAMAFNVWFILSMALYGLATLLWIHILQTVPLTIAYPFVALGFVIVPVLAWLLYGEIIPPRYILGVALLIAGLLVINLPVRAS